MEVEPIELELVKGSVLSPKHDNTSSIISSLPASITDNAHSCSSSQALSNGSGCMIAIPEGVKVTSVTDVVPVPEQAVIVEQSVTKLFVTVPETRLVPRHCGIVIELQDCVTTVAVASGVCEQAVTVVHDVAYDCVALPATKKLVVQVETMLAVQELLEYEDTEESVGRDAEGVPLGSPGSSVGAG